MTEQTQADVGALAAKLAEQTTAAFAAAPADIATHNEKLQDLKLETVRIAAQMADFQGHDELIWDMAAAMPDYDEQGLYQARSSLLALACAVLLGWLLGGFLSTFLGLIGLGGEILRPAAILGCVWLEEYLGTNPAARRVMLGILGLGALGRLASAMGAGLVRFTSLGSIRQLIFGAGARPNIFKFLWLWFGAFLLFVFFARKTTGIDLASFKTNLASQISGRLQLLCLVFRELAKCETAIAGIQTPDSSLCPKKECQLAQAALSLLDSLDADKAAWLASSLRLAGYDPKDVKSDYITWDENSAKEYEAVGLVHNGDRCLILKRPYRREDMIIKGQVQRLPGAGA